jgi:phosphate-selective porin OprO/OprP
MLTRDKATFRSVSPAKPFDLASDTFGAFEVVARVENLTVDPDAFPLFANPDTSSSEANAWGAGVNWYLTRNVKIVLDYEQTEFEGGSASGDRETERILFNRLQIAF